MEILRSTENLVFVRVSVLDSGTKEVLSQGEAYVWNRKKSESWEAAEGLDPGVYLFMKPVESKTRGFIIRAVELKVGLSTTLGLTIFASSPPFGLRNGVAYRIRKDPMSCDWLYDDNGEPISGKGAGFVCQSADEKPQE